jgi:hypothetical protein
MRMTSRSRVRTCRLSVVTLAFVTACAAPRPDPQVVEVVTDAGPPPPNVVALPDGGELVLEGEPFDITGGYAVPECASACTKLSQFGCPEAITRRGEDSCYVVCRRANATAGRIDFKPRCIATAKTLASLKACGTYRCL